MTLRITIEIVPHGDERHKRTLRTVNVSNVGASYPDSKILVGICNYSVKENGEEVGMIPFHHRKSKATVLALRALDLLVELDREQGSVL